MLKLKYSRKRHAKFSKEISETSFKNSHLWGRDEKAIRKAIKKGCVLLATSGGKLIGWLIIQPLGSGWIRFNTLYVKKDWRKKGVGKKLLKKAVKDNQNKKIYVSVTNQKLVKSLLELSFKPVRLITLPFTTLWSLLRESITIKTFGENLKLYIKHKIYNLAKE